VSADLPIPHAELAGSTHLILTNFLRWFGRDLVEEGRGDEVARLFEAPRVVLSALGTSGTDHAFNYANRAALDLFEASWPELIGLPSSASAEPVHRDERRRFLEEVSRHGFIADYSGIRISRHGRRFRIRNATVFNLLDDDGAYLGQAATFSDWEFL
jgi:hypothetical protein